WAPMTLAPSPTQPKMAAAFQTEVALPWSDDTFTRLPQVGSLESLFNELDLRALRGAPKSRLLAAGSISLNQAATLISAILVFVGIYQVQAPAVRFVIVVIASILPWLGSGKRLQENWVNNRLRSELLRSLLASHAFSPPLRPFAAELFVSEIAFLRSAAWKLTGHRREWSEERDRYLKERLDGQIGYLESKGNFAAKHLSRLQVMFRISSLGAMILGAAAILNAIFAQIPAGWVDAVFLKLLPAILPAFAAWSLSMIALFEYKRRAGLYRQLAERLRRKREELAGAKSEVTAANVVSSCERLLLTELWEWSDRGKRR
ncbi:MAG: SLATT domain-containing protein, partial [Verrucomicrobiaceae bacterium]